MTRHAADRCPLVGRRREAGERNKVEAGLRGLDKDDVEGWGAFEAETKHSTYYADGPPPRAGRGPLPDISPAS